VGGGGRNRGGSVWWGQGGAKSFVRVQTAEIRVMSLSECDVDLGWCAVVDGSQHGASMLGALRGCDPASVCFWIFGSGQAGYRQWVWVDQSGDRAKRVVLVIAGPLRRVERGWAVGRVGERWSGHSHPS